MLLTYPNGSADFVFLTSLPEHAVTTLLVDEQSRLRVETWRRLGPQSTTGIGRGGQWEFCPHWSFRPSPNPAIDGSPDTKQRRSLTLDEERLILRALRSSGSTPEPVPERS